jgi:hypothetical protein
MQRATRRGSAGVEAREDRAPDTPTKLPRRSWFGVLRRTVKEFREDNLTDGDRVDRCQRPGPSFGS